MWRTAFCFCVRQELTKISERIDRRRKLKARVYMMSLMMEVMMFLLMILLKVGYQPSLIRIEKKTPRAVLNIVGFREPASLLHCISYS
jgi:hypothetical protein